MSEYEIILKGFVNRVKNEIKSVGVDSMDGLCIYCAHNIGCDLMEMGIDYDRLDIEDLTGVPYSHQFLIVYMDDYYLVDPTYLQFEEKNESLILFKEWPAKVLSQTKEGRNLLNNLLNDGYSKINQNDINLYLNSFNPLMSVNYPLEKSYLSK